MPYADWEKLLIAYWPKFILHHDVGKWQDDEAHYLKTHVTRGTTFEIEDFAENYHIERKREHQSFYFCEIGVTLFGCMLRICVEDLSDEYLGAGEKQKLLQLFQQLQKPPIVLIAHTVVSEDLSHDSAFVQHVNASFPIGFERWLRLVRQCTCASSALIALHHNSNSPIRCCGYRSRALQALAHQGCGTYFGVQHTGRTIQILSSAITRAPRIDGSYML